jgi:hypothetical protein
MRTNLIIEFRHKQLYMNNDLAQPIVVTCNLDGSATYTPGLVGQHDWVNMTEFTEGLDEFSLSWSAITSDYSDSDTNNGTNQAGSNYDKGVSLELRFFDQAYQFIYDWLLTDPCQILNSVEARVTDMDCQKSFRIMELKIDNITLAPYDEPCILAMPLREADDVYHVFQKTIIEDNWQNWFNKDGGSVVDHPTFPFIVEKKPKFILAVMITLIYIVGIIGSVEFIAVPPIVDEFKRWARKTMSIYFYCPAPLIRTYILNVCMKYGFTFNTIFDDLPGNQYRDVCLFYPVSAAYKNFDSSPSPSTKFIWDNRTTYSFTHFLNQLKKVFNAEWYITPNSELVFQHKSYFENLVPLYDFTAVGADTPLNLRYTFNGKKKPAYGDYQYLIDPQDTCSNEVKWRYNAIVDFDGPANNPMLEGHVQKSFDFAMTAFHNDGSSEDYLEDSIKTGRGIAAVLVLLGLGELYLASNFITAIVVAGILTVGYLLVNDFMNNFFNSDKLNGCVRVAASEINTPRLLLWNRGTAMDRAKVVSVEDPAINPLYNDIPIGYYAEHPAHDAPGYFGDADHRKIYNYPMYVEELFLNNLYDNFHEYDNPLHNPVINQDFELDVELCCEWMDRLGVWENDYARIGSTLILEDRAGRKIKGRITEIKPSYKAGSINIKGNVLR